LGTVGRDLGAVWEGHMALDETERLRGEARREERARDLLLSSYATSYPARAKKGMRHEPV